MTQVQVPKGMLGPDPVTIDVRCFVVPHSEGLVLVDAGPPGSAIAIEVAINRMGAAWSDVTDIVFTHAHFDHIGGLAEVGPRASGATLWAGAADVSQIHAEGREVKTLIDGERVRHLTVLATPGHTAGHVSLLDEASSLVLVGDVVGNDGGAVSFGPAAFTADPVRARLSLERIASLRVDRVIFSHGPEIAEPNAAIRNLLRPYG